MKELGKNKQTDKTYRKQLNGRNKSFLISNHSKCKWIKLSY